MFNFSPRFGVVAEFNEYRKLGQDLTGGEFDARTLSAGIVYRF